MLFLQFVQYSSSFVGTPKNEIPRAALKLCQLQIKQFSPEILKFGTKHEDNPFTLNYYMVPRTFLFIFHAGSRRLASNDFWNSSYKEKTAGSVRFGLSFRFLWTMNWLTDFYIAKIDFKLIKIQLCKAKMSVMRVVSRTPTAPKMEFLVTIIKKQKLLNAVPKSSILDVTMNTKN